MGEAGGKKNSCLFLWLCKHVAQSSSGRTGSFLPRVGNLLRAAWKAEFQQVLLSKHRAVFGGKGFSDWISAC